MPEEPAKPEVAKGSLVIIGGGGTPRDVLKRFWDVLAVDHLTLLRNTVAWACNEPQPVEVEGPGVLDVTVWRQRDSMTVHLVNLTNPMMMKGPLRETIPIGPLIVHIRLPEGTSASKVQLLSAGVTADAGAANGALRVTVPSVDVHEVIALDL